MRHSKAFSILILAIGAASPVAAEGFRAVTEEYTISITQGGCGPSGPLAAQLCMPVLAKETRVQISIVETSPTSELDSPIAARLRFIGSDEGLVDFCDAATIAIPPGTTGMELEVHHGFLALCQAGGPEYSPAARGHVNFIFD